MKSMRGKIVMAFLILPLIVFMADSAVGQCLDISTRGHLNVMTINLLFSEIKDRQLRLERIADFVAEQASPSIGEPIDLILLQEVVGGSLSKTVNSSYDLNKLLALKGLNYYLSFRLRQWPSRNP